MGERLNATRSLSNGAIKPPHPPGRKQRCIQAVTCGDLMDSSPRENRDQLGGGPGASGPNSLRGA